MSVRIEKEQIEQQGLIMRKEGHAGYGQGCGSLKS